jgi:hypothetical protein
MTARSLPATENTVDNFRNWIIKESVGNESGSHILNPAADQGYDQYDMVVQLPWCGIADHEADQGDEISMHVTEGIQIDTKEIAAGALFATFGTEVWYDPTTKTYTDTEDAGLYLVGYVILPLNANGEMRFEKRRYVVEGQAT